MVGKSIQYPPGPSQHRAGKRVRAGLAEEDVSPADLPVSAPRDTQPVRDKFDSLRSPRDLGEIPSANPLSVTVMSAA
jgi:hypothetical protein